MLIIVGLGNPGKKYENTRHNLGFITVDLLADRLNVKINKLKHKALIGESNLSGQKILLVKPQTFMNLSGESVREIVDYYKVDTKNLVVIYDDFDIEMGSIRIRKKGGPGTHNGMKSVVGLLGSEDFPRIRIGLGNGPKNRLIDFVTGGFTKAEKEPLEQAVTSAVDAIECIAEYGVDIAMNKFNGLPE